MRFSPELTDRGSEKRYLTEINTLLSSLFIFIEASQGRWKWVQSAEEMGGGGGRKGVWESSRDTEYMTPINLIVFAIIANKFKCLNVFSFFQHDTLNYSFSFM